MLCIIIGASDFPLAGLGGHLAFRNAAAQIAEYAKTCLRAEVHSLFDDERTSNEQMTEIASLAAHEGHQELVLYYCGHGFFRPLGDHTEYYLAVRATEQRKAHRTAISAAVLAETIKAEARQTRRYLVLDACFSATIAKHLQAAEVPVDKLVRTVLRGSESDELHRGIALWAAASKDDFAELAPVDQLTHFSSAFLSVAKTGKKGFGEFFTLRQFASLVESQLNAAGAPIAQLHVPTQQKGHIDEVPLFPNPAFDADDYNALVSADLIREHFQRSFSNLEFTDAERLNMHRRQKLTEYLAAIDRGDSSLASDMYGSALGLEAAEIQLVLKENGAKRRFAAPKVAWPQPDLSARKPRAEIPSQGLFMLGATSGDRPAMISKDLGSPVFSHFLIEGLLGQAAGPDGGVSLLGAFSYIQDKCLEHNVASPVLSASSRGDPTSIILTAGGMDNVGPNEKRTALLVAPDYGASDSSLADVMGADTAKRLAAVLEHSGGFSCTTVTGCLGRREILLAVRDTSASCAEGLLLVYLVGHGGFGRADDRAGGLLTSETTGQDLELVQWEEIGLPIRRSKALCKIAIIDASFGGAGAASFM